MSATHSGPGTTPGPSTAVEPAHPAGAPQASAGGGGGPRDLTPLPLDLVSPQLTWRALLTGMVLACLLSACNIYLGLKIGWGLNMSITASLLGFGFWKILGQLGGRPFGLLENNINQTVASAGASVSSAGFVAPIPALTILTGLVLPAHWLILWVFSVCMVGIAVAIGLRRQMILVDKLPFAAGIATAETLRELYARGREAVKRIAALLWAAGVAAGVFLLNQAQYIKEIVFPFSIGGFSAKSLTFGVQPTLLFYAVGSLVGIRACTSMLVGTLLAWGILAPRLINSRHLRLEVAEPLPVLPAEVRLPKEPEGFAVYDDDRRLLIYKGEMTADERDALLARSVAPRYQEAVEKLYARSQVRPKSILWDEVSTTRFIPAGEQLTALPGGFAMPRELSGVLRLDGKGKRLVALAPLRPEQVEQAAAAAHVTPEIRAALQRLLERSHAAFPGGIDVPEPLRSQVQVDVATRTVRAIGEVRKDDVEALKAALPASHPEYRDYEAALNDLVAGATFRPVQPEFRTVVNWLLWPGVTLMVIASLVSFGFSWRSILGTFRRTHAGGGAAGVDTGEVSRQWFLFAVLVSLIVSVALQVYLFHIVWWAAAVGILLTFVLALVAGRVAGETNITPVGAMGKVTQLVFGALQPNRPEPNLMAANVTGGAASQCAELLHDLKCGYLVGALPRAQVYAQVLGALAGSAFGTLVYLLLIPDPRADLITEEWAAPAVATWKAVAELFAVGFKAIPSGTPLAIVIAGFAAIVLAIVEKTAPKRWRPYMLSPASFGLAFVIQAYTSFTMFLGALVAWLLSRWFKRWSSRFLVTIAAGLVAGESVTGVGRALVNVVQGFLGP